MSVWGVPALLAGVTLFGLLSALLGQHGVWFVLSWIALSAPLAVMIRCLSRISANGAAELPPPSRGIRPR